MKNKKIKISIGIPVHNEGENIHKLLSAILSQNEKGYVLHEIIVVSDGSSDNTVSLVRSMKDKRIKLMTYAMRTGKTARLNQICRYITGDILVFLDADIFIQDKNLFSKLIVQSNPKKDGLIMINPKPLSAHSFFEACINYSLSFQEVLRKDWNFGRNYLSSKGCFLALSKEFAKKLSIPSSVVSNDAFIYFKAKELGYIPTYLPTLSVFYQSPTSFHDHLLQSSRFQSSKQELTPYFTSDLKSEFIIPKKIVYSVALRFFLKNPLYFTGYCIILLMAILKKKKSTVVWQQAVSTKKVTYE